FSRPFRFRYTLALSMDGSLLIFFSSAGISISPIFLLGFDFLIKYLISFSSIKYTFSLFCSSTKLTDTCSIGASLKRCKEKLNRNPKRITVTSIFSILHLFFMLFSAEPFYYRVIQPVDISGTRCKDNIEIFFFYQFQAVFQRCYIFVLMNNFL